MSLRIAQFCPYLPPHIGGVEQYAHDFALSFKEYGKGEVLNIGFSCGQVSWVYTQNNPSTLILPALEIIPDFPVPALWRPLFWRQLQKIHAWNPTIIQTHTRFFASTWIGGLCAKIWRKKWVHIEHGSGLVVHKSLLVRVISQSIDATLGKWVIRAADAIICISKATQQFVLKQWKRSENVSTIYRWFRFIPAPQEERDSNSPSRLVFVGRLTHLKGVDLLLQALSTIQEKDWICQIVGDGEEKEYLIKLAHELNIRERVSFLGKLSHEEIRTKIYPKTDIFINPSRQEWLPTTVVEALLSGCLVIATDVGGTREIEHTNLSLIPAEDSATLSREISAKIYVNQTKQEGSFYFFSPERQIQEFAKIYSFILSKEA